MEKLYDIFSSLWLELVSDTLPDYIIEALNWMAFAFFVFIFLAVPIVMILVIKTIKSLFNGGRQYDN